jgi:hypothetical protein
VRENVRVALLFVAVALCFLSNHETVAADAAPNQGTPHASTLNLELQDAARWLTLEKQDPEAVEVAHDPDAKQNESKSAQGGSAATPDQPQDDGAPQVRLIGLKTDLARRYRAIIPPLPFPPFSNWRNWFREHENAVHCVLEWRDDQGKWWRGELRSTHFDPHAAEYRVGFGEFPGTAYDAYGIYIMPGRQPRDVDEKGKPLQIAIDEVLNCDYRCVEQELRQYAAKFARPGDAGTGGGGVRNVGLGGPAYKPAQNSNTMINYVLQRCGINHKAPDLAVGWDRAPQFPYSTDADMPALDNRP